MRIIRYMKVLPLFVFAIFLSAAVPLKADFLFLGDGSIIEGSIVQQKAMSVTVRKKKDGRLLTISGYEILRIRQKNIWTEHRWLRSKDGVVYHAFIVDESSSSWCIRRDISSAVEVTVPKDGSVFLNGDAPPAVSTAIPKTGAAELSWDGKGEYRIYCRKKGEDYRYAGHSASGNISVQGLKGSSQYEAVMTRLLPDGVESVPSEPVQFTTPNTPPLPPSELHCRLLTGKESNLALSWDGDSDEDGVVERYRVYLRDADVPAVIGTTMRRDYLVRGVDPAIPHSFSVTSVDDAGAESAQSRVIASRDTSRFCYEIRPVWIIPLSGLTRDFSSGYGIRMTMERADCFLTGLGLGGSSGIFMFSGKGNVKKGDAVPLSAHISYTRKFVPWFALSGAIEPGGLYLSILKTGQKRSSSFLPAADVSVSGVFTLTRNFGFSVAAEYGLLRRSGSYQQYCSPGVSLLFSFEF